MLAKLLLTTGIILALIVPTTFILSATVPIGSTLTIGSKTYTLQKSIGYGNEGEVFETTDHHTTKPSRTVIKVYHNQALFEASQRGRDSLKSLIEKTQSSFFPPTTATPRAAVNGGQVYVAVEILPRFEETLFDRIHAHHYNLNVNLTPTQIWNNLEHTVDLTLKLFEGWLILVKNHVVHGDLKPDNIGVRNKNKQIHYSFLDWGSAQRQDTGKQAILNIGTFPYFAPEIPAGTHFPTQWSDFYSIAAIVHEAITDRGLFNYHDIDATFDLDLLQYAKNGALFNQKAYQKLFDAMMHDLTQLEEDLVARIDPRGARHFRILFSFLKDFLRAGLQYHPYHRLQAIASSPISGLLRHVAIPENPNNIAIIRPAFHHDQRPKTKELIKLLDPRSCNAIGTQFNQRKD